MQNAKEIFAGKWNTRPYEVAKKGKTRSYRIDRPPAQWPTRLARPPSIHLRYDHVTVDGRPAPGLVVVTVLWALNNFDTLKAAGSGVYFYIPKMQTPREALIVERLLSRIEALIGVPAGTIKVKMLYEEGNGRPLPRRPSPGPSGAACWAPTSAAGTTWAASSRCGRTTRRASSPIPSRSAWPRRT